MGSKYTTTSVTGYNSSPPADDGSAVGSNQVKWNTVKTKVGDPLNTFASAIDNKLVTAFDLSMSTTAVAYTTTAADHLKPIRVTASATVHLGDAATMASSYQVTVINMHTANNTVDLATAGNKLNTVVGGSISMAPGNAVTFAINQAQDGYDIIALSLYDKTTPALGFNISGVVQLAAVTGKDGQVPSISAGAATMSWWAPRGYLGGLTLSNDGSLPNTVIDIAAGEATDSTNAYVMKLASAFTKSTSAFAAGTGNGALDTGSVANNTWYHVYLIRKTADGTVDIAFSTNATSPTVSGYGAWRRIGSFKTASASTNILAFSQRGDEFRWVDPIVEFASTTQGNAARDTRTYVGVPLGIVTLGHFIGSFATTAAATGYMYFTDLTQTDTAADINHSSATTSPVAGALVGFDVYVYTNTAQQIGTRANAATNQLSMTTMGWIDRRGRFT